MGLAGISLLMICNIDGVSWSSEKAPNLVALAMSSFPRWVDGVELRRMDIIWEILAKYLAIGIAAAAAFVIDSYALNYNWL
jgi:hypothetical protein